MFKILSAFNFLIAQYEVNNSMQMKLTRSILDASGFAIDKILDISVALGGLFLLFVIFVNVSHILDGGKFQVKMLLPVVIFICLCNFKLVASPVVSLVLTVQEKIGENLYKAQDDMLNDFGKEMGVSVNGKYRSKITVFFWDMAIAKGKQPKVVEPAKDETDVGKAKREENGGEAPVNETAQEENKRQGWQFDEALDRWTGKIKGGWHNFLESIGFMSIAKYAGYGAMGIVAELMESIIYLFGLAMKGLGAILTGIIVAFGPVTFAFAVFPGNAKNILSWMIRLFQFSLYAPITTLCSVFFTILCASLTVNLFNSPNLTDAASGLIFLVGILLGMLSALASVPTIASMIIEGAVGSLGLMMGINTAVSSVNTITSIWNGNMWKGEASRDNQQMDILREIANNTAGGGMKGGKK